MSEILAPAGDEKCALAAINAGADAIYLGLKQFSARNSAENFSYESFDKILRYAHLFGVKVYVAMNTMVKDDETDSFLNTVCEVWQRGADAIIISDLFLGIYLKKKLPQICLHLSTQAGVCNKTSAEMAKKYGFERVILSRETKFADISEIATIIETEVFIQGALCTCFSGQCYLSSFAGGNSGNRGRCKQPCRKSYKIDSSGFENYSYRLSLSDLCVGEDISKLVDAGVYSFKIEGRMRRPEYVSAAVAYYRGLLDGSTHNRDLSDLKRTYNRGNYTKGLAFGQDKNFISQQVQGHIGEFVGIVKVIDGKYICLSKNKFAQGDGYKILRNGSEVCGAGFVANVKHGFIINSSVPLRNGDKVFITTDTAVNERLLSKERRIPVNISCNFKVGMKPEIKINDLQVYGRNELLYANKMPLEENSFEECFTKTDKYPYNISFGKKYIENVFIAKSELNQLRRESFEKYFNYLNSSKRESCSIAPINEIKSGKTNTKIAVICTDLRGVKADIGILKPSNYNNFDKRLLAGFNGEAYLFIPPYMTESELNQIKNLLEYFTGIYCDGVFGFELCEKLKKPLFVGTGLNIANRYASLTNSKYIALSKELTIREAEKISHENTFYLTIGNIKIMDIVYCPFGKRCDRCDKRDIYTLTDESGRKFILRRYRVDDCRFELYNCSNLVTDNKFTGVLADCTVLGNLSEIVKNCRNYEKLKDLLPNYTRGHSINPIN